MEYRIFQLEKEIKRNLKLDWTVEKMADVCELSTDHFHKVFKLVKNQTPIQYLRHLRLEAAKKLLEKRKSKIKEIIYEVGIHDQTHFIRDFKKAYGVTPTKYRQNHWDEIQAEIEKAKNTVTS